MASLVARTNYGGFLYWANGGKVYAVTPRRMEILRQDVEAAVTKGDVSLLRHVCEHNAFSEHCVCFNMYVELVERVYCNYEAPKVL
jgi:hypothetical protein